MANDKSTTLSVFVEAAVDRTFGKVMAKVRRSNEQLVRDTEKANDASEKAGDTNKQTASTYRKVGQAVSQCTAKVAENTAKIGKNIRKNKELRSAVKDLSAGFDDLGNKGALVAAGGAFAFQQTFVKTAAEFEKMQVILNRLEGSQDKGAQSMAWISDFAATTPYDLAQVTESFIQLKAYGLDPVQNGLLRTLGDTSAAMGKPIEQAVEAIADAVTGENERLKEFGIKARVEGDEIVYAYTKNGKEMEARADASSREMIQSTLQSIWNDKYGGAMDDLSKTWIGMWSNIGDQATRFQNKVMASGAFDVLRGEVQTLLDTLNQMDANGELDELAQTISGELVSGLKTAFEVGKGLADVLGTIGSAVNAVAELTGGYANLAKIMAALYIGNKAIRGTAAAVGGAKKVANRVERIWNYGKNKPSSDAPSLPDGFGADVMKVEVINWPASGFGQRNRRDRMRRKSRTIGKAGTRSFGRSTEGLKRISGISFGKPLASLPAPVLTTPSVIPKAIPGKALLGGMSKRLPMLGSLFSLAEMGSTLMDSSLSSNDKFKGVGGSLGGMGGAMAGASLGAAMGSFVPVIGTAIGGLAGAVIGGLGGESVGEWFGGLFGSDKPNTKPGDSVKKANTSAPQMLQATNTAMQINASKPNQSAPAQINFNPVFHVQGSVNDEQINKLEKMVMRVAKQMEKLNNGGRNVSFAD
ncbi:hypothetical protein E8A66_00710 [Vibrio cholerae]|nr:hypothetical protein [Vibrio cholerae]EGR4278400.1 hypothetical protein [Vibrio cholerae]EKS2824176.1 hypothetical protein [Vibrio cholerae]ELH0877614.1 hypothetical protein [Vibrio cholerae]HAS3598744.1 hypothetical protein [Vibrio cholerae]